MFIGKPGELESVECGTLYTPPQELGYVPCLEEVLLDDLVVQIVSYYQVSDSGGNQAVSITEPLRCQLLLHPQ